MKKIVILIALTAYTLTAAAQTEDKRYRKEFEEFVSYSLIVDVLGYLQDELDEYIEKQPEEIAGRIREVYPLIEQQYRDFIFNEMIEVYRPHIGYKELRGINKFYHTKAGRALRRAQYPIMTEMVREIDKLTGSISGILAGYFTDPIADGE